MIDTSILLFDANTNQFLEHSYKDTKQNPISFIDLMRWHFHG